MKRLVGALILSLVLGLSGCTVSESMQQRHRRMAQVTNLQMRMATEDWDYIWLYDRNCNLTEWQARIGA